MAIFQLELKVHDAEALRRAAEEKAVDDGLTVESWRETRGGVTDDLIMLLDPGSLPGCSIIHSTAEE